MDNGYREITKEEAHIEAGDQAKSSLVDWHNISAEDIGKSYHEYDFNHWEYRRPIAQDHYATPTDKIVEHALDATSNAPDEWPSETGEWDGTGNPPVGTECEFSRYGTNWNKCLSLGIHPVRNVPMFEYDDTIFIHVDGFEYRPILTPAQAEEREREEVISCIDTILADPERKQTMANAVYDWLKSMGKLKDKSDE